MAEVHVDVPACKWVGDFAGKLRVYAAVNQRVKMNLDLSPADARRIARVLDGGRSLSQTLEDFESAIEAMRVARASLTHARTESERNDTSIATGLWGCLGITVCVNAVLSVAGVL